MSESNIYRLEVNECVCGKSHRSLVNENGHFEIVEGCDGKPVISFFVPDNFEFEDLDIPEYIKEKVRGILWQD